VMFDKTLYCRPCLQRLLSRRSTRTFTSTPARRKHGIYHNRAISSAVPTFQPTSSAALDALLSTFRTNIFLPAQLLSLQRNLIYKHKNHRLLTNTEEPATVKLGSEVHQLHPLHHLKDEPNTRKSLAEVLRLCKEGRDWVNVIPFLEGLKKSGRVVKGWQFGKIVRKMSEAGCQGVVMEMLRQVEKTGCTLGDVGVCREVMWGAVSRAVQKERSEEGVKEAARLVEAVWDMLSEERHVERKTRGTMEGDPKMRADVVGCLLWGRAVKSTISSEGKDEDGKVRRAVEMLLAVWKNAELGIEEEGWYDANEKLMMWTPAWQGMRMARKVVGENTPLGRELESTLTVDLEPLLKKAKEVVSRHVSEEGSRRGLLMFEELSKIPPSST
ncbi:MAG: hypothetical protein Q9222_006372, partial [Ikaeria aurantiellina]